MSAPRRLRIGGGARRGLKLYAPRGIRPTAGRLREALFNLWAGRLEGCALLDLFAGSGAVGIEAASRGAARVLLVEGDPAVYRVLERNRRLAELAGVEAIRARLPGDLARTLTEWPRFDLVFVDPPYGFRELGETLAAVAPHFAATGEIAVEHRWDDGEADWPAGLVELRSRRYGDSVLSFLRGST